MDVFSKFSECPWYTFINLHFRFCRPILVHLKQKTIEIIVAKQAMAHRLLQTHQNALHWNNVFQKHLLQMCLQVVKR